MAASMDDPARRRRRATRIAALLLGVGAGLWFLRPHASDDEPGIHVHPGMRTTWLDGPLRSDGTIDYVAFLRSERQRGVTPENDLAPILSLCRATPLRHVPPATDRERPPSPYVTFWSWGTDHHLDEVKSGTDEEVPRDLLTEAETAWLSGRLDGPFSSEIRNWLAEIAPALDLIQREARVRDHWYEPPDSTFLISAELTTELKSIVPCYLMRAVGRDVAGDPGGAVEDLETAFSLIGRWRGWDGMIGYFAILACEGYAANALAHVTERGTRLSCADFRRIDATTPRAPRDEQLAEFLPWERLTKLHMVVQTILDPTAVERVERTMDALEQEARELVRGEADGHPHADIESALAPSGRHDVAMPTRTMDRLLDLVNQGFDARASALIQGDWEGRIEALREMRRRSSQSRRPWNFHWDFWRKRTLAEEQASDPEWAAHVVDDLDLSLFGALVKTTIEMTLASDAARLRLALACFKNEFGRLPRDLDELAAACFDALPRDRFYRESLGWTVRDDGSIDITARGALLAARLNAKPPR